MQQSHFQNVTVKEVSDEQLVLEFENGSTVSWPRAEGYLPNIAVGDTLVLTLTETHNIINDLLHSDHGNRKNA